MTIPANSWFRSRGDDPHPVALSSQRAAVRRAGISGGLRSEAAWRTASRSIQNAKGAPHWPPSIRRPAELEVIPLGRRRDGRRDALDAVGGAWAGGAGAVRGVDSRGSAEACVVATLADASDRRDRLELGLNGRRCAYRRTTRWTTNAPNDSS